MSLLAELREASPVDDAEQPWELFRRVMPALVPGFQLTRMDVFAGGRVTMRAKSPMRGQGKYYLVLTISGAGRAGEARDCRLGVSAYRDEADVRLIDRPFQAFLDQQPGAVAAWLAGVLLAEDPHSERRIH